jgi:hypothetical protein
MFYMSAYPAPAEGQEYVSIETEELGGNQVQLLKSTDKNGVILTFHRDAVSGVYDGAMHTTVQSHNGLPIMVQIDRFGQTGMENMAESLYDAFKNKLSSENTDEQKDTVEMRASQFTAIYQYGQKGELLRKDLYDATEGTLKSSIEYIYDDTGTIRGRIHYNDDNEQGNMRLASADIYTLVSPKGLYAVIHYDCLRNKDGVLYARDYHDQILAEQTSKYFGGEIETFEHDHPPYFLYPFQRALREGEKTVFKGQKTGENAVAPTFLQEADLQKFRTGAQIYEIGSEPNEICDTKVVFPHELIADLSNIHDINTLTRIADDILHGRIYVPMNFRSPSNAWKLVNAYTVLETEINHLEPNQRIPLLGVMMSEQIFNVMYNPSGKFWKEALELKNQLLNLPQQVVLDFTRQVVSRLQRDDNQYADTLTALENFENPEILINLEPKWMKKLVEFYAM